MPRLEWQASLLATPVPPALAALIFEMLKVIVALKAAEAATWQIRMLAAPVRAFGPRKKVKISLPKYVKKMTVEEKVGQLVHVGINARFANQDSPFFKDLQRHVVENKVGGIIFFGAPIYETTILANRMQQNAKLPLLMSLDAETGIGMRFEDATNFPWAMAVTATGNPEFARRMGVITGREAKAIGIRHVYAPVLDVNNNAANPVINVRSFGEDPRGCRNIWNGLRSGHSKPAGHRDRKTFPRPWRHECRFTPRPADHRIAKITSRFGRTCSRSKKPSKAASARS